MKKTMLFAAVVAAAGLASCSGGAPKANLKSDVDSLSYMMGITNTQGLDMYITQQLGVDTAFMADFIRGVQEGTQKNSPKDIAYAAGLQIGQQVSGRMFDMMSERIFAGDSTQSLNKENFLAGFIQALKHQNQVKVMEANDFVRTHAEAIQAKAIEKKYAANKEAGEKFLAENAQKEGVKTTPSGLQYKVIKEGKGEIPTDSSVVKVHYTGTLIDGTKFDSSLDHGKEPSEFPANGVIKGWTEALTMMPVGSKWELYIPQELAYGAREVGGDIKPFSALIFEVELVGIQKNKK